ncbi:MAG: hypothetical protein OXG34_09920, partial [bacterium]|nr:hypothetical protein [bacterium]
MRAPTDIEVPLKFSGTGVTASDKPTTATFTFPKGEFFSSHKLSVPTDTVDELLEEMTVAIDADRLPPIAAVAPQVGTSGASITFQVVDTNPTKVTLSVPDGVATERTYVAPGPALVKVDVGRPLDKAEKIELPLLFTPATLVRGTDYDLRLKSAKGVSLEGATLTFDGAGGDGPQVAEISVIAPDGGDTSKTLSVAIPTAQTPTGPNAPVITATGFTLDGKPQAVTGTGTGTITFIDDDPSPSWYGYNNLFVTPPDRVTNRGGALGEWQFARVGETDQYEASLGIYHTTNRDINYFVYTVTYPEGSDARGGWTSTDGEQLASEIALRGGEVTRNGVKKTVGPSIELQNAPDGMSIHSLRRRRNDHVVVTFRMTEAARAAFTEPQDFQVKIGGMLLDQSTKHRSQSVPDGQHCTDNDDLSTVGQCRPIVAHFRLQPGRDGRVVAPEVAVELGDTTDATATYAITLDRAPSSDVTVTPTSGDTSAVTAAPVVFRPGDANGDAPLTKMVTVTAVHNDAADNPGGSKAADVTISHAVTTNDNDYKSLTLPDVTVDLVDDEPTEVSLTLANPHPAPEPITADGRMLLREGGGTGTGWDGATVTVSSSRPLRGNETLAPSLMLISDTGVDFLGDDRDVDIVRSTARSNTNLCKYNGFKGRSISPTLEFTSNVSLRKCLLDVKPFGTDDDSTNDAFTIRLGDGPGSAVLSNLEGGAVVASAGSFDFVLYDTSAAQGIDADVSSLDLDEGSKADVKVSLDAEPAQETVVTVAAARQTANNHAPIDGKLSFSPTELTFSTDDWYQPQTVAVTAAQDADVFDHTDFDVVLAYSTDASVATRIGVDIDDDDAQKGTLKLSRPAISVAEFTGGAFRLGLTVGGDYRWSNSGENAGDKDSQNRNVITWKDASATVEGVRYAKPEALGDGSNKASIALAGAPAGLDFETTAGGSNDRTLTVPGAKGGATGTLKLRLSDALKKSLSKRTTVTVRLGGRLTRSLHHRYGGTGGDNLCATAKDLDDTACPPMEATFELLPLISTPVDAEFVSVPDDLVLAENADGSTTKIKIGSPVAAADFNGDTVAYSLKSPVPSGFEIDASTGQLAYSGTGVNREALTGSQVALTVVATSTGADGTATGVEQAVTVAVSDVDEGDATVALRADAIGRVGHTMRVVSVSGDPDGDPATAAIAYQWQVSADSGSTWASATGSGNATANYTVASGDAGKQVRVQASYTDGGGNEETVHSTPVSAYDGSTLNALLAVTDAKATEEDADDTAKFTVTLGHPPIGNESVRAVVLFSGGQIGDDFDVSLDPAHPGQSMKVLNPGRVDITFQPVDGGPPPTTATIKVKARADDDAIGNSVTLSTKGGSYSHWGLRWYRFSGSGTITITDDDDPSKLVSFADAVVTASEGGNTGADITATLKVTDSAAGSATVTVIDGTATWGDDYTYTGQSTAAGSGRRTLVVSWPAGSDTTPHTFTLRSVPDTVDEAQAEHFSLRLSDPTAGFSVGAQRELRADITDDDPLTVSLHGGGVVRKTPPDGTVRTPELAESSLVVRLSRPLAKLPDGKAEIVVVPLSISGAGVKFGTADKPDSGDLTWQVVTASGKSAGVTATGLGTAAPSLVFTAEAGKTVQQATVQLTEAAGQLKFSRLTRTVNVRLGTVSDTDLGTTAGAVQADSRLGTTSFELYGEIDPAGTVAVAPRSLVLIEGGSDLVYHVAL